MLPGILPSDLPGLILVSEPTGENAHPQDFHCVP
jgi:hypothetical protein